MNYDIGKNIAYMNRYMISLFRDNNGRFKAYERHLIDCACGCRIKIYDRDSKGRPRKFYKGHQNRGKNNPYFGRHPSKKTRKLIGENHVNVSGKNNPFYGEHHSEESKAKISDSKKGKRSPMKGKKLSEEAKKKIRFARMKRIFPMKNTSIEKAMAKGLDEADIKYIQQFPFMDRCVYPMGIVIHTPILLIIPLLLMINTSTVMATNGNAFKQGYSDGLSDGKGDVRDSIDACSQYSGIYSYHIKFNDSRPAAVQCYNGYDLGFKEGCKHHVPFVPDPSGPPEYPTCDDYFAWMKRGGN